MRYRTCSIEKVEGALVVSYICTKGARGQERRLETSGEDGNEGMWKRSASKLNADRQNRKLLTSEGNVLFNFCSKKTFMYKNIRRISLQVLRYLCVYCHILVFNLNELFRRLSCGNFCFENKSDMVFLLF
jgi:hypothetical protein